MTSHEMTWHDITWHEVCVCVCVFFFFASAGATLAPGKWPKVARTGPGRVNLAGSGRKTELPDRPGPSGRVSRPKTGENQPKINIFQNSTKKTSQIWWFKQLVEPIFFQNWLKWVGKGPPGLSISQDASKSRSESDGMPPRAQNPLKQNEKTRKYLKIKKIQDVYKINILEPPSFQASLLLSLQVLAAKRRGGICEAQTVVWKYWWKRQSCIE